MPIRIENIKVKRNPNNKKYYKPLRYPEIPLSINDIYIITSEGDRLDLLANQFYYDTDYWWVIATANPNVIRRDSIKIKSGIELRIPQNIQNILNDFEQINK